MLACPYPSCSAVPAATAICERCDQALLWCPGCAVANRLLSRFCRGCGRRLPQPIEWRQAGGGAGTSSYSPAAVAYPPALAPDRRLTLPGELQAQFVYAHGHLFFPVGGRGVGLYREHDGKLLPAWVPTRSRFIQALAVTDELLLVAGDAGLEATPLVPLLSRGRVDTRHLHTGSALPGSALLVLEELGMICYAADGGIHGLPLAGGARPWSAPRRGQGAVLLTCAAGNLVVVEESGEVWGVDPVAGLDGAGRPRWQQKLERIQVQAGCAAWEEKVYLFTAGGGLWLLYADNGNPWKTPHTFHGVCGVACNGAQVLVVSGHGMYRLRPTESEYVAMAEKTCNTPLVVTDGGAFVITNGGDILGADLRAQSERFETRPGVSGLPCGAPVIAGQRIYIGSEAGEVVGYLIVGGGGAT